MKKPVFLQIVGRKKSGKTTLIVALTAELTARGFKLGTVKHTSHDHEFDQPGTDSWKHRKAGAGGTFIISPNEFVMHTRKPDAIAIKEIMDLVFAGMDIVLWEGRNGIDVDKIECVGPGNKAIFGLDDKLIATVSEKTQAPNLPNFAQSEMNSIVEWILSRLDVSNISFPDK